MNIIISAAALLLSTAFAYANTVSVGPVRCSSPYTIDLQCSSHATGDGGGRGHCDVIATPPSGKRVTAEVVGTLKRWDGSHPIRNKITRSFNVTYEPAKMTCRYTPSANYSVGDCAKGVRSGSCTLVKNEDGFNVYYKASAVIHD
jgi:hypothetical protein